MRLANGDRLPAIAAIDIEGTATTVGDVIAGSWSVVLLYRGHW